MVDVTVMEPPQKNGFGPNSSAQSVAEGFILLVELADTRGLTENLDVADLETVPVAVWEFLDADVVTDCVLVNEFIEADAVTDSVADPVRDSVSVESAEVAALSLADEDSAIDTVVKGDADAECECVDVPVLGILKLDEGVPLLEPLSDVVPLVDPDLEGCSDDDTLADTDTVRLELAVAVEVGLAGEEADWLRFELTVAVNEDERDDEDDCVALFE